MAPSLRPRRSALLSLAATAALGLVVACATAPVDDPTLGADLTSVKSPTDPAAEVKLPPASAPPPVDASAPTDASTPKPDAGPPPAQDSGPPPPPPPSTPDCDPNDPTVILKLLIGSPSGTCPCSAGQCCLLGSCL
jgi:hypothetical protein